MKTTRESRTEWSAEIELNSRDQLLKALRADGSGTDKNFQQQKENLLQKEKC
jgi:hypothetical protein